MPGGEGCPPKVPGKGIKKMNVSKTYHNLPQIATDELEWGNSQTGRPEKAILAELQKRQKRQLREKLLEKVIHGKHAAEVRKTEVDAKATHRWLVEGKLSAETECVVVTAQDGVTGTRAYKKRIQKKEVPPECRVCGKEPETIGHIMSACQGYLWTLFKERHDRVLYLLVKTVMESLNLNIPDSMRASGGVAKPAVYGTEERRVLVDQNCPTMEQMEHTRPDLVLRLAKEKRIHIMDVACSWEPRVTEREKEKKEKYQPLAADLAKQWQGYKVTVTPVVMGTLGLVTKMREDLRKTNIFSKQAAEKFAAEAQREVVCSAVRIIKRHMKAE